MRTAGVIPLVALAAAVAIAARVHARSRPLVAPAAAAIYGRLLPEISRDNGAALYR
jgi:hypothetical protein